MVKVLEQTVKAIGGLDRGAMKKAGERLDGLIKPPGSLGILEDIAVQIAGITGRSRPQLADKAVIVMAGDHGVVEEGVSVAAQEVTAQMLPAFVKGVAGIGVLARYTGARLVVVDVGVAVPVSYPGVLQKKVKAGTANISLGPAMTREEAVKAVETGIEVAFEEMEKGAGLLALGDMGIGNTTASSAILAAIGGYDAALVTGRGTLVNDEVLMRKERAVRRALEINQPDPEDGLDVLSKVGGLEIGALAGVILAAAARRVPVVLDGFITTAAALIAQKLAPQCRDYMIASHLSEERGHRLMLELLGLSPVIHLRMRLGEGTGAALAILLIEAALKLLNEMATFEEARVTLLDGEKILKNNSEQ